MSLLASARKAKSSESPLTFAPLDHTQVFLLSMSVLESLTTLQESLLKRLPQLQAPASLHPLHVNPSTLISARNDLRGLLTSLSHTVTSFEDVAVTTRAVSTLRKWSEDFPSRPPHDLPRGNKRRRYAAAPPGLNAMETLEWLVQEVGGFESFRAEGVLTIGGKAIVVDVEPERGAVRMTYGMESKEAPWVVERLKENLTDSAALAVKLEALARLDALMAEVGETRDVFEELQGLMDRLYSLSEAFRCVLHFRLV